MNIDLQTRRMVATLLVALFAIASNLVFFGREAKHYASPFPQEELNFYDPWNELAMYQDRFRAIRARLDPEEPVGYVSDTFSYTHFCFAQYALAPVVLVRDINHPTVVGNFKGGKIPTVVTTNAHLVLTTDFGNGVALFHRHKK